MVQTGCPATTRMGKETSKTLALDEADAGQDAALRLMRTCRTTAVNSAVAMAYACPNVVNVKPAKTAQRPI